MNSRIETSLRFRKHRKGSDSERRGNRATVEETKARPGSPPRPTLPILNDADLDPAAVDDEIRRGGTGCPNFESFPMQPRLRAGAEGALFEFRDRETPNEDELGRLDFSKTPREVPKDPGSKINSRGSRPRKMRKTDRGAQIDLCSERALV
ncbi:hypothetical protein TNCT_483291 [Trichonephila clavata]|uniref:Uncharacterized protein n=1 Tax=Trichonephila clavata TaxID=2740835 RepID=A0A8X6H4D9_TRICU|nr:hypothetical protein TNCT_483291 [Trichonephila clavata]